MVTKCFCRLAHVSAIVAFLQVGFFFNVGVTFLAVLFWLPCTLTIFDIWVKHICILSGMSAWLDKRQVSYSPSRDPVSCGLALPFSMDTGIKSVAADALQWRIFFSSRDAVCDATIFSMDGDLWNYLSYSSLGFWSEVSFVDRMALAARWQSDVKRCSR